jgi:hypothetical protein
VSDTIPRHLTSLLLVAVALACYHAALAQQPAAQRVALLVGVNHYDKRGFRDLEFAERDVEELAQVLKAAGYDPA